MLTGYLSISPWLIGFLVFVLGPLVASIYLSFTKYNLMTPPTFLGLENYRYILFDDPLYWPTVGRTLYFSVVVVILGLGGSLACALLLTSGLRATNFFRTAFFIPSLTPIVAAALIWRWLLQPKFGPVNALLAWFGIEGPSWLQDPSWAIPSLIIIRLWLSVGGGTMIIFIAGLQGIPRDLYEAAKVDGANRWAQFRFVTLPMLTPTIFFNLIISIIGAFKVFTLPFIATTDGTGAPGGPAYATWFYLIHLYQYGFDYFQMGYASALAWLFFIAVLALTVIQFALSRHWVYYESERDS